jgi:hypothetical protein
MLHLQLASSIFLEYIEGWDECVLQNLWVQAVGVTVLFDKKLSKLSLSALLVI